MYFNKINHIHVCSAVGFSVVMTTAFKYFWHEINQNPFKFRYTFYQVQSYK